MDLVFLFAGFLRFILSPLQIGYPLSGDMHRQWGLENKGYPVFQKISLHYPTSFFKKLGHPSMEYFIFLLPGVRINSYA